MPEIRMTKACDKMVIDQPRGLHEGITYCGTDKIKSARFQVLAKRIRFATAGGDICGLPTMIDHRPAIDKTPDIRIKAAKFFLHFEEFGGIADRGIYFQAIADNARIGQ